MLSVDNTEMKKSLRRSKKVKNLEEEVEFILSQDESEGDCNISLNKKGILPKTPTQTNSNKDIATPNTAQTVLQEFLQTPRRSCRKSIKPTQDYEEIVNKSLRYSARSAKKNLMVPEENENEVNQVEIATRKWTPAKVGRVSNKRSRKSRRTVKATKQGDKETKQLLEETTFNNENDDTKDVTEAGKTSTLSPTEKIIEQNNQVNKIERNTLVLNVKKENIRDEHILEEITEKEKNDLTVKEIIKQEKQVDEIVDNMEHLNVKNVNNCQKRRKIFVQGQRESDEENQVLKSESKHLVQEDSEDCQKIKEISKEDEICIVFESNISNREKKKERDNELQSHSQVRTSSADKLGGTFGCYLKSKDLNISDLGLNPIKDEDEKNVMEINNAIKSSSGEVDEMPSLIFCDDDDEIVVKPCNKLNETFEANDSVIVVGEVVENSTKPTAAVMETLQMSDDDCETPGKRSRLGLTDTELKNHLILSTPKEPPAIKSLVPSTPQALATPKSKKLFRFPTPYRNKQSFKFNNEFKENVTIIKTPIKNDSNVSMISLTTLEPKEIVLRGIRKRSLSVCIDGNEHKRSKLLDVSVAKLKQERVVSFYSPANQTTVIDDLDIKISKSLKTKNLQEKDALNKFVTTRRKRSISLDDSIISNSLLSKLPRPVTNQNVPAKTQTSSSTSKQILRTKLPNFSAIHQKRFKKMENLVDHVHRKQERSNNLINSATKLRPVSVKKNISIIKKSDNISTEKSKALQKIDLVTIQQMNKSLLNSTATTAALINSQKLPEAKLVINLPDPRLGATKVIKTAPISHRLPQQQQNCKYLKPSQITNLENTRLNTKTPPPKATFNLSTSLMVKPTKSSSSFVQNANTSRMINDDKTASRLQRHMDLFKGRVPSARSGVSSRKNEILKGVRSNRRFELQMQHRKNLEQ